MLVTGTTSLVTCPNPVGPPVLVKCAWIEKGDTTQQRLVARSQSVLSRAPETLITTLPSLPTVPVNPPVSRFVMTPLRISKRGMSVDPHIDFIHEPRPVVTSSGVCDAD